MRITTIVLATAVLLAAVFFTITPVGAENPEHHHPNLFAAHKLAREAYEKVTKAQEANEWDMDGHAKHAKELLEQVNAELKIASEDATKNK